MLYFHFFMNKTLNSIIICHHPSLSEVAIRIKIIKANAGGGGGKYNIFLKFSNNLVVRWFLFCIYFFCPISPPPLLSITHCGGWGYLWHHRSSWQTNIMLSWKFHEDPTSLTQDIVVLSENVEMCRGLLYKSYMVHCITRYSTFRLPNLNSKIWPFLFALVHMIW